MGQKIHPYGFRLGIVKDYPSNWFAHKHNYAIYVFEDLVIREFFLNQYPDAGIVQIQINRKANNHIKIAVFLAKPNILIHPTQTSSRREQLSNIQKRLERRILQYRTSSFYPFHFSLKPSTKSQLNSVKLTLTLIEIKTLEQHAEYLADFLIEQLEKRVAFRRAIKKTVKRSERSKLQGLKIQIAGRLNGAEIARTEWIRKGRVPLQTIDANIDYACKTAKTIYGLLGVKVWIFLDSNTKPY